MPNHDDNHDDAAQSVADQYAYHLLAGGATLLVVVATIFYRSVEDWSWVDSVYFSVVAATTVGFGDLSPTTDSSKIFTIFYIIAGVALIGTYLNVALQRRATRRSSRRRRG